MPLPRKGLSAHGIAEIEAVCGCPHSQSPAQVDLATGSFPVDQRQDMVDLAEGRSGVERPAAAFDDPAA